MTVAIGIAFPEGLVIAADSRLTTYNPNGCQRVASDYNQKVFSIGNRIGLATNGMAFLSGRSISSLINELSESIQADIDNLGADEIIGRLVDYFEAKYNDHIIANPNDAVPKGRVALGFTVGGYIDSLGQLYSCLIPGKVINKASSTASNGWYCNGDVDPIVRLLKGYDNRLDVSSLPGNFQQALDGAAYRILLNVMTLQDVVDFAIFLIEMTIHTQRFTDGIVANPGIFPGVGGPVDVIAITQNGIEWVQKKELRGKISP